MAFSEDIFCGPLHCAVPGLGVVRACVRFMWVNCMLFTANVLQTQSRVSNSLSFEDIEVSGGWSCLFVNILPHAFLFLMVDYVQVVLGGMDAYIFLCVIVRFMFSKDKAF